MPFEISDECLVCGVCMDECPVEAISEAEDQFFINPGECTDCGSCREVCPNDSISQA